MTAVATRTTFILYFIGLYFQTDFTSKISTKFTKI